MPASSKQNDQDTDGLTIEEFDAQYKQFEKDFANLDKELNKLGHLLGDGSKTLGTEKSEKTQNLGKKKSGMSETEAFLRTILLPTEDF